MPKSERLAHVEIEAALKICKEASAFEIDAADGTQWFDSYEFQVMSHNILERALRELLEQHEDSERLEAMIAGNWNVEVMPCGPDIGVWFVFDTEARCVGEIAEALGKGSTPRAAIDDARKGVDHD